PDGLADAFAPPRPDRLGRGVRSLADEGASSTSTQSVTDRSRDEGQRNGRPHRKGRRDAHRSDVNGNGQAGQYSAGPSNSRWIRTRTSGSFLTYGNVKSHW